MAHLSTIKLLREWARWGESHNVGYPGRASFFGERALKMPLFGTGHIPDDIWHVEQAVCRIDWMYRHIVILRYQRHMGFRAIGAMLQCDWRTARRRLKQAEDEVHHELVKITCSLAPTSVDSGQHKIVAPNKSLA